MKKALLSAVVCSDVSDSFFRSTDFSLNRHLLRQKVLFRLLVQESINMFIEVKQVRSNRRKTQTSETSSVFEFPKIFTILESAKSGIIISFESSSRLNPYSLRSIFVLVVVADGVVNVEVVVVVVLVDVDLVVAVVAVVVVVLVDVVLLVAVLDVVVVAAKLVLFVMVLVVEVVVIVVPSVVVVVADDLVFSASVVFISELGVSSDELILLEIVEKRSKSLVCESIILSLSSSSKSLRR